MPAWRCPLCATRLVGITPGACLFDSHASPMPPLTRHCLLQHGRGEEPGLQTWRPSPRRSSCLGSGASRMWRCATTHCDGAPHAWQSARWLGDSGGGAAATKPHCTPNEPPAWRAASSAHHGLHAWPTGRVGWPSGAGGSAGETNPRGERVLAGPGSGRCTPAGTLLVFRLCPGTLPRRLWPGGARLSSVAALEALRARVGALLFAILCRPDATRACPPTDQ